MFIRVWLLWFASVQQVTDLRILSSDPLPAPAELCHEISRSPEQIGFVAEAREKLHRIIHGEDKRLLCVVGPCSIHDLDACREYAGRFRELAGELDERLLLVLRVYFEKPRTNLGWKGLIMDPKLNGTCDIPEGLRIARRFLHCQHRDFRGGIAHTAVANCHGGRRHQFDDVLGPTLIDRSKLELTIFPQNRFTKISVSTRVVLPTHSDNPIGT